MKKHILILIILIIFFTSCDPHDNEYKYVGIELLTNNNIETDDGGNPQNYWRNGGDYTTQWYTNESLQITSTLSDGDFGFWAQTIHIIPSVGKKLKLTAKIKTESVIGEGVCIAIRCDDTTSPISPGEQFTTTQHHNNISGTMDWTQYEVELEKGVGDNILSITVYLILGSNTQGTVYFDDISLIY